MRKTQYGWMALGGLLCLFGLVLACKLRDGNKAIAQADKPAPLTGIGTEPPPPPAPPRVEPAKKPLPSDEKPKTDSLLLIGKESPGIPSGVPIAPEKVLPPPSRPSDEKPKTPLLGSFISPSRTPSGPLMQSPPVAPSPPARDVKHASFNPNTPTPPKPDRPKMPKETGPENKVLAPKSPTKDSPPPLRIGVPGRPAVPPAKKEASIPKEPPPVISVSPMSMPPLASPPPVAEHEAKPLPGEPPLAPAPGPVQMYQVRASETLQDIARRTLGSSERWNDIHKLNPTLKPDVVLAAGTTLRLPGDACVQAEDGEPVKPLPALRPKPATPKAKVLPLTGTYMCSLDDKNRLTLPRALREQLGGSSTVLMSPGPDQCLWLTNQAHLERLAERLEQSQAREADVRVFKRLYFAQTEKVSVAGDGRVSVNDRLVQFAGLHQELVLVGIDDHFEVWDAARWRQYTQQKSAAVRPAASPEQE